MDSSQRLYGPWSASQRCGWCSARPAPCKKRPDKDLDLVVEGEGIWPAIQLLELIENQELPEGFQLKQSQSLRPLARPAATQHPSGPNALDLSSAKRALCLPGAHPELRPTDLGVISDAAQHQCCG